nr:uncharacterized protein LOC125424270 [Ziziphus jujuba var. spinosa]
MTKLCKQLEFSNFVIVEATGLAGGLTFMWKKEINFELKWSLERIINGIIKEEDGKESWWLIACHGTQYHTEKEAFWNHLEKTILKCEMPWVVIGDLNDIFEESKKFGGRIWQRSHSFLKIFVEKVGAIDLGFSGKRLTWENKQDGRAYVKERLDRVTAAWDEEPRHGMEAYKLMRRLNNTALALKKWNKFHLGYVQEKIKAFEKELEESQFGNLEDSMKHAIIEKELGEQRARLELKKGDIWLQDRKQIGQYFEEEFSELFTTSNSIFTRELEELGEKYITDEENIRLMAIPSEEEIRNTVWELHPLKAPGPDGFLGVFYKNYWDTVKSQLIKMIQESFRTKTITKGVNKTLLVLIPKSKNAASFNQFWPISLCNFKYKVVAKIIVSRLRPLLSRIISPNQETFIEGRWIAENTVVAQEILHKIRNHKGKNGLMLIKISMKKA